MNQRLTIVVLPGDHIGPEITAAAAQVLAAADSKHNLGLTLEEHAVGYDSLKRSGTTITDNVMERAKSADGIILGPCDNSGYPPVADGGINVPGKLRNVLDLYANLRPSYSRPGIPNAREGLDVLIARENTEGFYPDRNMFSGYGEVMPVEGVAISMRKITAKASNRIARAAFDWAQRRRRKVSIVTKKHILRMTDGLFYDECVRVATEYPDVEWESVIVDAFNADIYLNPSRYDVVVMTNMFGDIISNLCSALSGGLGLGGGINAGDAHAMANAAHGSAPDIAGQDKANPVSMITSAAMLLEWMGARHGREDLVRAALEISQAVDIILANPQLRTADLGGPASTRECTDAIVGHISN
jgi:3-isopropylmalate dehydrogenase